MPTQPRDRQPRGEGSPEPVSLELLVEAMGHPVRGKLLFSLIDSPRASAKQLSHRIGEPPSKVRYHLRKLRDIGLVGVEDEESRRGVVERYYRSLRAPVISAEDDRGLDDAQKRAFSIEILRLIFADAARSISAGTFIAREDRCLTRISAEVDEEGWRELAKIHFETLEAVKAVVRHSGERLQHSGEEPIRAVSDLLLFEYPAGE
jgi:DNA-binding transcriptional ArsR family regulator